MIKLTFFTKKSWKLYFDETEYAKWTKDLLEIEYSWKVSISFITKPFQATEAWDNLTKDSKTLLKITKHTGQHIRKNSSPQFVLLFLFCKFCLLVVSN